MVAVETSENVVYEEVRPPDLALVELGKSILRVQEARKRLLQIPEPMHAHYDVFPGGIMVFCHPLGECPNCR
jgi:hypothetical protein